MEMWMVIALVIVLLILLLVIEMPVAFALGISGGTGLVLLHGTGYTSNILASVPFSVTSSFTLTIVPMFILMGMFAVRARIAEQIFAVANYTARRIPGGLGVATVMACAGFAAVSGSSVGTAATMSKLSVGQMRRYGYPDTLASGVVAMAGTLGILIPPSVMLVLYAIMTGESVGAVLAAGIIPGLLSAVAYMLYIMFAARKQVQTTPQQSSLVDATARAASDARPAATRGKSNIGIKPPEAPQKTTLGNLPWRGVSRIAILFAIVIGGIYSGLFTSTESAAIGAVAALIMLVLELRKESLKYIFSQIIESLKESASTTSMVFAIVVGSAILSTFFVAARVPESIAEWVAGLGMPPMLTMALLLAALIPLGMALESLSILVITVPILYPVAMEFGFDGVWLAIIIVKLIEIGLVTPPVGVSCFVVSGTSGVKVEKVFRGVLPFIGIDLLVTVVLFLFPVISLWLPSLIRD